MHLEVVKAVGLILIALRIAIQYLKTVFGYGDAKTYETFICISFNKNFYWYSLGETLLQQLVLQIEFKSVVFKVFTMDFKLTCFILNFILGSLIYASDIKTCIWKVGGHPQLKSKSIYFFRSICISLKLRESYK